MAKQQPKFELSRDIERYLAALSKLYAQDGKRSHQELIVNAQVRVHEEWSYDSWDGGTYGHALFLTVPPRIFLTVAKKKDEIQTEIRDDINKLHNVRGENVDQVFLEMEVSADADWRRESGLLVAGSRQVPEDSLGRIWQPDKFRLFLSHKSSVKRETSDLKEQLGLFGFSAFVAHADIHPTKAWQEEIENALASMDGFVALMTSDFHESDWTDQEVGYALARGVPILAVRLGRDPYGFIGKFQGVSTNWKDAPIDITKILVQRERAFASYVHALRNCPSWDDANTLSKVLPALKKLSPEQVDELVGAYNETSELRGGWGFNGGKTGSYGPGLVHYLNLAGNRQFKYGDNQIEVVVAKGHR